MYVLYYICGFAGGLALGAFFKVPALVAATFAVILAAAFFVAFRDVTLTTALETAIPALICMQFGYLIAAAVQGRRRRP